MIETEAELTYLFTTQANNSMTLIYGKDSIEKKVIYRLILLTNTDVKM